MILCLMWGLFLYYIETCKSIIIHQGAISIIISDRTYSASENLWSLKVSGRLFNYKIEILKGNNFAPFEMKIYLTELMYRGYHAWL